MTNEIVTKKKILRWKKQPSLTGLARIGQGERGFGLWYGDEKLGGAYPRYEGWGKEKTGYYWYCRVAEKLMNTAYYPVPTIEECKVACEAYARGQLGLPLKKEVKR